MIDMFFWIYLFMFIDAFAFSFIFCDEGFILCLVAVKDCNNVIFIFLKKDMDKSVSLC